jgi:aspartate/methionine/tyrosine aminotransferase
LGEWLEVAKGATREIAVVVNNPVNPTGRVWAYEELEGVARLVRESGAWVVADETYADFVYGTTFVPFATLPGMAERTVTIRSASKELRIPSYRLGYATGPTEIVQAMATIAGECAGSTNFAAHAAVATLPSHREFVSEVLPGLDGRRQTVINWAAELGLEVAPAEGGFFAFVNVGPRLPRGMTTCQFVDFLLARGVGVVPGEAFAPRDQPDLLSGWVRISYAGEEGKLMLGLQRIEEAIRELRG